MDIESIELTKNGNVYFLYANKRPYKINRYFYQMLLVWKTKNCSDIELLISDFKNELDPEHLNMIKQEFNSFIAQVDTQKNSQSYIKARLTILNSEFNAKFSSCFSFLFNYKLFNIVFPITIAFQFFYYLQYPTLIPNFSSNLNYLGFLLVIFLVFFLHEVGHSAAVIKYGRKPEEIGFGFYYIFPVFYSNISLVWSLPKKERLMVNMAGIFFQSIINSLLIALLTCFSWSESMVEISTNLIRVNILIMLYSLLPFLRNDGYWVYSDLFNIENLMYKSDHLLKLNRSERNVPLLLFSIANWFFKAYLLFVMGSKIFNSILRLLQVIPLKTMIQTLFQLSLALLGMVLLTIHIIKIIRGHVKQNEGI